MEKIFLGLVILMFLSISYSNLKKRKEIKYRSLATKLDKSVALIVLFIFLGLAYKTGGKLENYLVFSIGFFSLVIPILSMGIGEKGFYYLRGRGLPVRIQDFKDIRLVKCKKNKDFLRLESQGQGEIIVYNFPKEKRQEILDFLREKKVKLSLEDK